MNSLKDIEQDIKDIIEFQESDQETDFVLSRETLPVIEKTEIQNVQVESEDKTKDFDVDFEYVRTNLKDIIGTGSTAIKDMMELARISDNPKSYDTIATLLKSVADINTDLLKVHKQKDERVINSTTTSTNNTQNNTIFVGSTAEFSKLMKVKKDELNNEIIHIDENE